ncbi:uncharacterized protein si:dkey-200l5.4 isoform X2 [Puntigrus tetrazona]|uniref:uncharacterized protein si:dkey-200l5.4 isoform X2 n=1 Tax=Puntigrus tetrazona TaxID=1606681 RepID=UPI001C89F1DF|nr:uncharacterized protein si:dkey-200l5.4 isoform X2 [Puntigrus tetrazona]
MRISVTIILFVAVAGFHSVISASLQCDEKSKLPEERAFEENSTTPQTELGYEAAHVKDGETKAVTDTAEEEDSVEQILFEKEDSNGGEREALTDSTGANTGSDASMGSDSEDDTSQQNTEHSEQVEENVKISEDFSDEEYGVYYDS